MKAVEIAEGVYWVGAIDWDVRMFHGYHFSTHRGTTYNAYLVVDEKIALVDTVLEPFSAEMLARIESVVPVEKIDLVVSNHVEIDHSGGMPALMQRIPHAPVYCTGKGKEGLFRHYGQEWDWQVVKTGDAVSLGKRQLTFLEAPMLHWPDSMFTYLPEESLLLPNDAFGQHIATSERYADEWPHDALEEAAKYYANILMPFSRLVQKKLEEVAALELSIKTIAPSHGLIWRNPAPILEAYRRWSEGATRRKAVVIYDTMWGSTEALARQIVEGLIESGVETVLLRASVTDRGDIIKEVLEGRVVVIGSPTINNDSLSTLAAVLEELHDLKPQRKLGAIFGSYGWAGGAEKALEARMKEASIELIEPPLRVKYRPAAAELAESREFGKRIGARVIAGD